MTEEHKVPIATFYAYDIAEVDVYSHATNYMCVLTDIQNRLRGYLKYGQKFESVDQAINTIYSELLSLRAEYHLPDDL